MFLPSSSLNKKTNYQLRISRQPLAIIYRNKYSKYLIFYNPLLANVPMFPVFRGYKIGTMSRNGLRYIMQIEKELVNDRLQV